ncbi:MAG: PAS domain S-box protein [Thermodesulfobacteriota bacterium]
MRKPQCNPGTYRLDWIRGVGLLLSAIIFFSAVGSAGAADKTKVPPDFAVFLTEEERAFLSGKQVRLGVDQARPPFEYLNDKGDYVGISSEFIKEAAKKLGLAIEPQKSVKWTEAMEKVKVGEIDVIPKVTPSMERQKFMNFTKPYITFPSVIVTRKDRLVGGLDDLVGLRVGVIKGQIIEASLRRDRPEFTLVSSPDIATALRDLATGKFDVFIDNLGAVAYTIDTIGLPNLRIAASTPYTHDLAFGVRKDWPLLAFALDKALASMTEQEKAEIKNRWLALQYKTPVPWHLIIPIGAALLAIVAFVLVWNRRLRRVQKELRGSQKLMQDIINGLPFWLSVKDRKGRYLIVNSVMAEQHGIKPEAVIGKTTLESRELFADGLSKMTERDQRVLDTGQPVEVPEYKVEINKEIRSRRLLKIPWKDDRGSINGIISWSEDITERKKAEERFQVIAASIPGAIFQAKAMPPGELQFLYLSPGAREHFGLSPEAVIQGRQRLAIQPQDQDRFHQAVKEAVEADNQIEFIGEMASAGQDRAWFRLVAKPARDESGDLIYNGLMLDITRHKLAELEYLASERKVLAMSQAISDALVMIDGRGKVLFWNQAAEKLFGITKDEALGMDFHEMAVPAEDREKIRSGFKRFAETGQGVVFGTVIESNALDRQGRSFPVEVSISSFQVDKEWFAVGTVRDITERKQAEEAVNKSERRLKSILETAAEGFQLIDNKGKILEMNSAMRQIYGREQNELVGKSLFDLVNDDNKKIFAEQLEARAKGINSAYEMTLTRPDGSQVACFFNPTPLYDDEGNMIGSFAMVTDITQRRQAEDMHKESEERYRLISENSGDVIWLLDMKSSRFKYVSPSVKQLLGYSPDEVMSQTMEEIMTADSYRMVTEGMTQRLKLVAEGDHSVRNQIHRIDQIHRNGTIIPTEVVTTLMTDQHGKVTAILGVSRDITERAKVEEELKQYVHDLERFNKLVIGREEKMIQLKEEVNELRTQIGQKTKYKIVQ